MLRARYDRLVAFTQALDNFNRPYASCPEHNVSRAGDAIVNHPCLSSVSLFDKGATFDLKYGQDAYPRQCAWRPAGVDEALLVAR